MTMTLDLDFNFFSDTPAGKDPDAHSPTLRRYHKALWSKPLPCGRLFELSDDTRGVYLHHTSDLGEFFLSSDGIGLTLRDVKAAQGVVGQLDPAEMDVFFSGCCTIGGYIVFPSNKIDRKMTINGARGLSRKIRDRIDLTLECIRRHYAGEDSPLHDTLARYTTFFELFESFEGYVSFFLLDELVDSERSAVRFLLPFDDFQSPALPLSFEDYLAYKERMTHFVRARGRRMQASLQQR